MKVAVIGSRNLTVEIWDSICPKKPRDRLRRGERNRQLRQRICQCKRAQAHRVSAGI